MPPDLHRPRLKPHWTCVTLCILGASLLIGPVAARDARQRFNTGGGAGGEKCPAFLNAMASARQSGGLESLAGVARTSGYIMYVLGFQTGFNSEAVGIYDIWAPLGEKPGISSLYAIERWCADNPGETFSLGVLVLAHKLKDKARTMTGAD